jgi:hydroxyacylglutathione hydrolase
MYLLTEGQMKPVLHVPAFEDNYIWLVRGASSSQVALVDPGDAQPVLTALQRLALTPVAILCTHHHGDHVGGVQGLVHAFPGLPVYGPGNENISGITHPVSDGDQIILPALELKLEVLAVPGHTRGHLAYVGHGWLFCGDTLFSAGCGRLFEGTAAQMYESLSRLAALPDSTLVYCAHEYTLANLRFARTVEPENPDITAWTREAEALIGRQLPSIPSTIARERAVNPFLRSAHPDVRRAAEQVTGHPLPDVVSVFAAIRQWKDRFRG